MGTFSVKIKMDMQSHAVKIFFLNDLGQCDKLGQIFLLMDPIMLSSKRY
jgi:hypothetical protein